MNLFKQKFIKVPKISILESLSESTRNPFVDWILILLISLIVTTILIINSINLYQRVITGNIKNKNIETDIQITTFNQKDLDYIINKYDKKQEISNQMKSGYNGPSNPAI